MKLLPLFILFTFLVSCDTEIDPYDFYVSPTGNDANSGTKNDPFATLDKARLAVRELKKTKKEDITIGLKGGKHILRSTVNFTLEDSGSETQKITYKAVEGETPILTSENPVSGWALEKELSTAYPVEAKGKIWSAPLPEDAGRIKYLFEGNKVLSRSMTKGFIPPVKYNEWVGVKGDPKTRTSMKMPEGVISNWKDVKDMELVIIPTCDWKLYNRPLVSYDATTQIVQSNLEEFYGLGSMKKGNWKGTPTAWIANSAEGMLEEGNWYVNTQENKIYLFSKEKPTNINVPMLVEYIRLKGERKPNGEDNLLIENIHFEGLVFTNGKRFTWNSGTIKNRKKYYDISNSLLKFQNVKNSSITRCAFENSGAAAIILEQGSQNNRIQENVIRRIGGEGIQVNGNKAKKGNSFGNLVKENHIHHNGEADWGASGIIISQSSKNHVVNNLVHHNPYNAIRLSGSSGDNTIEYNEIHHAVEVLGDGNAFYVVASGKNNRFQYNYIHDVSSPHSSSGIRTDGVGSSKNMIFIGNIIQNTNRGGLVLKGKGHKAINNIFIDCFGYGLEKSWEGGKGWLEIRCGFSDGMELKNNIFYATFNKSPLFMGANTNESMPQRFIDAGLIIEFDKIKKEGNICYSTFLDDAANKAVAEKSRDIGFQLDYKKITAISFKDGKVVLNPEDHIFQEGYEYIDINKIGIQDSFPQKWLDYTPEMLMKKYLKRNR